MKHMEAPKALRVLAWLVLTAAAWPALSEATGSGVKMEASGPPERIVLHFTLEGWQPRTVMVHGQRYLQPCLEGEAVFMEAGAPSLPKVCRSVILPDEGTPSVRVLHDDFYEITARIAPSKGSIPRTVDPAEVPYSFGPAYGKNAFHPGTPVRIGAPYILRDHRGAVVELHPFQFNPATGNLRIRTRMTVEVSTSRIGGLNPRERWGRSLSRAFHGIYKSHFLNYNLENRYNPLDEDGDLLIICHDPWLAHVQPLVEYRKATGIHTKLVPVSDMGNDPAAIKACIQQVYDTSDLAFVLLVGDAEQVASPHVKIGGGEPATSDPTYSLLEGGDPYPDIMVGRFSAETADQVCTQVERTIEHGLMPAAGQSWFWKGTGIGSDQGPGDDGEMDWEHIENIRQQLLARGYTEVDPIYDPGATAGQVTAALEDGRGIVNYCGHGGSGGWGTSSFVLSHLDALINHNMLPFIFSVACGTGEFEGKTGMGEAFLWASQGSEPTGGIGFYGGSATQYWSEPMEAQDEFNLRYAAETYACLGTLCYAGSCSMMDKYGNGGVDMFLTWHLFGDPSLQVTGTPPPLEGLAVLPFTGLKAEGAVSGPFDPPEITYTLTNAEAVPLDFDVVADAPWIDLSQTSGTLPPGGETQVTVRINALAEHFEKGHYEAAVDFIHAATPGGKTRRMVTLDAGVPVTVYVFDLDKNPGWSMTGEWEYGRPAGKGGDSYGYPDPASGATGDRVLGVNLEGDYSTDPGGPFYLTTPPIHCEHLEQVRLRFQRWLNSDFQPYFFSTLEVSNNGKDWVLLWENPGSEIAEHAWHQKEYDLSDVADRRPKVYIRWGYEKGSPAYPYSGWNIDDIEILGVKVKPIIRNYRIKPGS